MNLTQTEAKTFINSTYAKAWKEFSELFPSIGDIPTLEITENKTKIAGRAFWKHYDRKWAKVQLNLRYAMTEGNKFEKTIYHELAHIICWRLYPQAKQAHGPEFRSIMQMAGKDDSTYHSYSVAKAKSISLAITVADL